MRFAEVAVVSERVATTSSRGAKAGALAGLLAAMSPDEAGVAAAMLAGRPRQGRIGIGWSTLTQLDVHPAAEPTLEVLEVDRRLDDLATVIGGGSAVVRRSLLSDLFGRATAPEQHLLRALLGGELRQGASAGVVLDAVARGSGVPPAALRRAHMLSSDLGETARAAFTGGTSALAAVSLRPGRAVAPMLAAPARDVADALAQTGPASVEWKLDGARIQAHRSSGVVRLFTRSLHDITDRLPAVVEVVSRLGGGDLVLDGEVAGLTDDGRPRPFQDTMGDFGADALTGRGGGLGAFFFDVLHADGAALIDEPLAARRGRLAAIVPAASRLPSIVTADPAEAAAFADEAVRRGQEGVMVKALDSVYAAGRRGGLWRKVKPVHTFDLVVLAAEWGHGRRRGWLSNLHLGARGDDASFVMVGKTFKGLTDEVLAWQTEALRARAIGDTDGLVVHVRPELVVEVAVDGVQRSSRYPGGVTLRFARVRRYRADKPAAAADPIGALLALL